MAETDLTGIRPNRHFWFRVDRFVRSIHLYTGLFLVPWMMVYAASALLINHGPALREWFGLQPSTLQVIDEAAFMPDDLFPEDLEDQAAAILKRMELDGAHRVLLGQSNDRQLKILRICARGNYVVTWNRVEKKIVVQQQRPFSSVQFINFFHFKGGYAQPYPAHILWAVVVDLVALSLAFWVLSGIYIWARRPKNRLLGGITLLAGSAFFVGLVLALCC